MNKTYVCTQWPFFSFGKDVQFQRALFSTDDESIQKFIESSNYFGRQIVVAPPEVAQEVSGATMAKRSPKVRLGLVGSRREVSDE